ncbi:hypothetical protein SCOR_13345 [Sulfidibacter corallicola]
MGSGWMSLPFSGPGLQSQEAHRLFGSSALNYRDTATWAPSPHDLHTPPMGSSRPSGRQVYTSFLR